MVKKIYESITLTCKECGKEFIITLKKQKYFISMGYELPKRYAGCY